MRRLLSALLLTLVASPLAAQKGGAISGVPALGAPAAPHRFAWVLDGALEFGGDVLFTVQFTDGSEQDILAGQGGTLGFGTEFRGERFGLRTTAGVKFSSTAADNANIMFLRFPLKATANWYPNADWRVAAGPVYHVGNSLKGDGFFSDVDFDPAMGLTAEVAWRWIGASFTTMKYQTAGGPEIDAAALGITFSGLFGKR